MLMDAVCITLHHFTTPHGAMALRVTLPRGRGPLTRNAYAPIPVYQTRKKRSMFMRNAKRDQPTALRGAAISQVEVIGNA